MTKKIVEKMWKFMVLVLGIGMFLGCNKEANVVPVTSKEPVTENQSFNFKSEGFKTFSEIREMLAGQGSLALAPAGYRSVLPPSPNYQIWLFQENKTGKITEIYVCNSIGVAKEVAEQNNCDRVYSNMGNQVCCQGSGSQCRIYIDECGDVCIVLCLA